VFRVDRQRGPVWYAKYRLPDGRQVQRKLGPAWTERGRPPAGYFTKRTAEEWLRGVLEQARRGTLPGMVRTGVSFDEAADEYLRYVEHDRGRKPSTVAGYRWIIDGQLRPAFGPMQLEAVTPAHVEAWSGGLEVAPASRRKALVILHGVFQRARKLYGLPVNPVADVEKPPQMRSGDIDVFSPEEVWALVRAADGEQDAAMYLMAAFTGLRMGELLALRWRDADLRGSAVRVRASYTAGSLTTPK
jgi:integrase